MQFGMSVACYRWYCYPPTLHDNKGATIFNVEHPGFLNMGLPLPYTSSVRPPQPGRHMEWIVDKAASLGLSPLHVSASWFETPEQASRGRAYAGERGVALIGGGGVDLVTEGVAWEGERDRLVGFIRTTAVLGAKLMVVVHSAALEHNHFTKDPPVSEQIRILTRHFQEVVPYAEEAGVVLAFENHMDYRCSEIATVVNAVDSPWLGVNYDFGNSYSVIEDPLDAAMAVADRAVMAHLKDMRIQPKTLTGEPRILWAPLGLGNVPIREILDLLQRKAPDPAHLPLCLEVAPLPDQDPDIWVKMSIDYMQVHHARFLTTNGKAA